MRTDELLKKVRRLRITTGRTVNELFAGEYSSAFKGQGMEFDEVRAYAPGDDVRTIDWNVTARTGEPHIKRYVEERELTVMLAVDLSASGSFGSRDRIKNETAAELCAVLAMTAIRSNDKVGLLIFTDHVEHVIPPAKGSRHAWRVVRDVLGFEPEGRGTDATAALDHLARICKKRAVIVLVSDFLFDGAGEQDGADPRRDRSPTGPDPDNADPPSSGRLASLAATSEAAHTTSKATTNPFEHKLRMLARRHDVIAASIRDPRESELVGVGLVEVEDAETGERTVVDTGGKRRRKRFEAWAGKQERALERRMRRLGIDLVRVRTDREYIHDLFMLFKRRERRR